MSIHLLHCAAEADLAPSLKLALMAFADSADQRTQIALPGLEAVKRWAAVRSDSRAKELVAELVAAGYLVKHRGAHRGRRAEYVVFPGGCCDLHTDPAHVDDTPAGSSTEKGSATPDPDTLTGSATPDPISELSTPTARRPRKGSATADATLVMGPERVRHSGPLGLTTNTPPYPPTPATSPPRPATLELACSRHGAIPELDCRGCGTTSRQLRTAALKRQAEAARTAAQAELRQQRQRTAAAAATPATAAAFAGQARAAIRRNR